MGLSLTIREDHDLCAISIGTLEIPGDYWPYNVRPGSGERLYIECGKTFNDNSREWPELTTIKKLRLLLPPGIQAPGGSGLFCGMFTLLIASRDVVNLGMG